jgi:hypothetical protein
MTPYNLVTGYHRVEGVYTSFYPEHGSNVSLRKVGTDLQHGVMNRIFKMGKLVP